VLRAADGERRPHADNLFASGLDGPFGIAFYPPGPDPQWVYVANTGSVVRFAYRSGDLKARGRPETIVRALPKGGHTTRDLVFSQEGGVMCGAVGSWGKAGEGMKRRSPDAVGGWEAEHGLGAAGDDETGRAAVLVFDPDGRNRRIFAGGL